MVSNFLTMRQYNICCLVHCAFILLLNYILQYCRVPDIYHTSACVPANSCMFSTSNILFDSVLMYF